jgi:hypothetical protein
VPNLRERLGRELGEDVDDILWEFLQDRSYVAELEDGTSSVAEVASEIRAQRAALRPRRTPAEMVGPPPTDVRDTHAWALSAVVARMARSDRSVQAFREAELGGGLLSWEEVPDWVQRHADVGPPTTYLTTPVPENLPQAGRFDIDMSAPRGAVSSRTLSYMGPDDKWVRLQPTRIGPLEHLRHLSEGLAPSFAWTEAQATVFVLTDIVPFISPARVTSGGHFIRDQVSHEWARRITLVLDPTLQPAEVARIYQDTREKEGHRGRRRLSLRQANLAAFVAGRAEEESWEDARRAWNAEYPKWRYEHGSNFRRDAVVAQRRLLYPDWSREG